MTTKELELLKRFWFAYHRESLTCGETEQLHHEICLEVAELLNRGGVCYRELRMSKKCDCSKCKNRAAASAQELGRDRRELFTKLAHSTMGSPK